jgi:transposase-like protein
MRKKDFSSFLAQVGSLSAQQKAQLAEILVLSEAKQAPAQLIDEEFSGKATCPACASESVHKWGVVSGLQRYRCKECKRTFNALTGTPMARLRKKELWEDYSQTLSESLSLTKAAARCGIDRTTAFRWRHRFLPLPGPQAVRCSGITEMDETYFRESFKG